VIAGAGKKLGLYGFGAAAHIIAQVAKYQGRSVFAFTRPGDVRTQTFARGLGAAWAGGSDEMPPESRSTLRSSLPSWAISCPWPCRRSARAVASSARGST
jgi:hypothetical protein